MSDHLGAGTSSRTCCVYCGARIESAPWIACERHRSLVALDAELSTPVDESVDDSRRLQVYAPRMLEAAEHGEDAQARKGTVSR